MSIDDPTLQAIAQVKQLAELLYPYHRQYERQQDERAVFAYVYHDITLDLIQKLEDPASGFEDPVWVAKLACAFGKAYMAAMDALDAWLLQHPELNEATPWDTLYETVPRPWADVFRASCREQSYVLEDLIYAMMAHISYDLPHALLKVQPDNHRLADFHLMNEVLANRTEQIQDQVADRYDLFLIRLDKLAGSFDEFFTNYGIRASRSVAWYNAMRLSTENCRQQAEASIQRSTFLFIQSVRHPKEWWLRLTVRFFRFIIPRRRKWPG